MQINARILTLCLAAAAVAAEPAEHWVATWGTAQTMMLRTPGRAGMAAPKQAAAPKPAAAPGAPQRRFGIPPFPQALNDQTVRMVVRTSIGGSRLRVRLTNALGGSAVRVGAAHVARRAKESEIVPGTDRTLTFGGRGAVTLVPGQTVVSDPVALEAPALADLAVSLYLAGETGPPTSHLFGLHTTYVSRQGDFTGSASIPDATRMESYYWLAGVDVAAPREAATLVTFGDSITDGDQSTNDANGMWPAVLAARLQANKATRGIGVVNAGISGNRVLGEGGALARIYHDVISQPGLKWVMLLEGINDITGATRGGGAPTLKAEDLIAAYRQIIALAHLHGARVIGCTITPYGGSPVYTEAGEAIRQEVNAWIRAPGNFDAVVDFDAAVRDPKDPKRFRPEADSPDLLHPGDAGYKLMGNAVDLRIFRR